jgi:hypothetical protein
MTDDFSESVKRALASRVGNLCSNPDCRAPTSGPQEDPAKAVNLGVAAHITAASPGGPRYDPELLSEERSGPPNGLWLCQNCAKLIDNDPSRFAANLLKEWKNIAEAEARNRVGKTAAAKVSLPQCSGVSETKRCPLGDGLTHAERELLDAAVHDPAGQITHRRPTGPDILSANGRSFIEKGDPRSGAKWLGALESLERRGLIRATSAEKYSYAVTQQGHDLAEELGRFVRWSTSEILLKALYLNRSSETVTLACTGVVEVPPIFYPDQPAADGGLMRSRKRNRALLVEGINPQILDVLSFEPTDARFVDAATTEMRDFRVSRVVSGDRKTLLLEINE